MKRKSIIEAVIVAAALLGMYECAVGSADREFDKNSVNTAAADYVVQESGETQQDMLEEEIDYAVMDAPVAPEDEGDADLYMTDAMLEEDLGEESEKDFYERHRDMDFDGDGEITKYEGLRWDFIHTDLEAEVADLKMDGYQTFHLSRYVLAYLEMDTDEYEQLSPMEQADCLEAAYAQMCSDRNMTMGELEDLYKTDLRGLVQEIRESDPHYRSASDEELEDGPPSYSDEPQDPSKKIDLDSLGN